MREKPKSSAGSEKPAPDDLGELTPLDFSGGYDGVSPNDNSEQRDVTDEESTHRDKEEAERERQEAIAIRRQCRAALGSGYARVSKNLTAEIADGLLDEIAGLSERVEFWFRWKDPDLRRTARKKTPGKVRRLRQQLQIARETVDRVRTTVFNTGESSIPLGRRGNHLLRLRLEHRFLPALAEATAALHRAEQQLRHQQRSFGSRTPDQRDIACLSLMTFLRKQGIQARDAEVRIAIVSNTLWQDDLSYADRPDGLVGLVGCEPLRKRLTRVRKLLKKR